MSKCLSEVKTMDANGLYVLVVGSGSAEFELELLKMYRIAHLATKWHMHSKRTYNRLQLL